MLDIINNKRYFRYNPSANNILFKNRDFKKTELKCPLKIYNCWDCDIGPCPLKFGKRG